MTDKPDNILEIFDFSEWKNWPEIQFQTLIDCFNI
jgi:hypothetical protein